MQYFDLDLLSRSLTKFSDESFEQYFHELVDSWLMRHRLNYAKYAELIDLEDWWHLEKQCDSVCRRILSSDTDDQILQLIKPFSRAELLFKLYQIRKYDLRDYFSARSNNISDNLVKDFDWNVKLALSSDKFAKLNKTLCRVGFSFENKSPVQIELDENELDGFISTLEMIQGKLKPFE